MIKYQEFINESLQKKKPERKDLRVGLMIETIGDHDNLNLNNQVGEIIEMKEYGYILIQFLSSFSKLLHNGHKNIGKDKHCFYVKLENIYEIIPDDISGKIKNKDLLPYRASNDLIRLFKRIKYEPSEKYLDISFFDIDKKNMELISYLPSKKFDGNIDTQKGRQTMKVGRILKKLKPALNEKQLEDYVTSFWGAFKIIILNEGKNLQVVTGEDIRFWYSNENYCRTNTSSTLWNSCMSSPSSSKLFDLYCDHPDKIALCILLDENDKLRARALIWKTDDGNVYMDRIYSINDADRKVLYDYSQNNGMLSYYNGTRKTLTVTLNKDYTNKSNPYLDSFTLNKKGKVSQLTKKY